MNDATAVVLMIGMVLAAICFLAWVHARYQ